MIKIKIILNSILFFICVLSYGQYQDYVIKGRPGKASGPLSVGKNVLQIANGLDIGGSESIKLNQETNYIANSLIIRYGITEKIELNTSLGFRKTDVEESTITKEYSGLSSSSIGAMFNVFRAKSGKSALGVQFNLGLPIKDNYYNHDYLSTSLSVLYSIPIIKNVGFTGDLGISYDGSSPKPKGTYIANIGYTIDKHWSIFIENYGNYDDEDFQSRWDAGVNWTATNQLKLDAFGGYGSNDEIKDYFVSLGLTYRFLTFRSNSDSQN